MFSALAHLLKPWWHAAAGMVLVIATTGAPAQIFPGREWETSADVLAAGWSADKLEAASAFTRSSLRSQSWMLVHRGVVIHHYGDVGVVSNIASSRKSVLSILIGMEVDKGGFALDRTLAELGIDDRDKLTDVEKTATVRQLLQARSGIYHPSAYEAADMKRGRPARGTFKPGENFNYNNWDFNALGTIYRQTTGRTVFESLRDQLARPLQMQDYELATGGYDVTEPMSVHPAYLMRMSTRDMARIGLLMSRGGTWNGQQLVSRRWVDESTTAYSTIRPGSGYGYMWWVGISDIYAAKLKFPGRVFLAVGNLGQYLVVDPVRDIVFVHKFNFEGMQSGEVTLPQFVDLLSRVLDARIEP
jgi:CubicO group peptidase (beta-lactamase class C family)